MHNSGKIDILKQRIEQRRQFINKNNKGGRSDSLENEKAEFKKIQQNQMIMAKRASEERSRQLLLKYSSFAEDGSQNSSYSTEKKIKEMARIDKKALFMKYDSMTDTESESLDFGNNDFMLQSSAKELEESQVLSGCADDNLFKSNSIRGGLSIKGKQLFKNDLLRNYPGSSKPGDFYRGFKEDFKDVGHLGFVESPTKQKTGILPPGLELCKTTRARMQTNSHRKESDMFSFGFQSNANNTDSSFSSENNIDLEVLNDPFKAQMFGAKEDDILANCYESKVSEEENYNSTGRFIKKKEIQTNLVKPEDLKKKVGNEMNIPDLETLRQDYMIMRQSRSLSNSKKPVRTSSKKKRVFKLPKFPKIPKYKKVKKKTVSPRKKYSTSPVRRQVNSSRGKLSQARYARSSNKKSSSISKKYGSLNSSKSKYLEESSSVKRRSKSPQLKIQRVKPGKSPSKAKGSTLKPVKIKKFNSLKKKSAKKMRKLSSNNLSSDDPIYKTPLKNIDANSRKGINVIRTYHKMLNQIENLSKRAIKSMKKFNQNSEKLHDLKPPGEENMSLKMISEVRSIAQQSTQKKNRKN